MPFDREKQLLFRFIEMVAGPLGSNFQTANRRNWQRRQRVEVVGVQQQ